MTGAVNAVPQDPLSAADTERAEIAKRFERRRRRNLEMQVAGLKPWQVFSPPAIGRDAGWLGPGKPFLTRESRVCLMGSCLGRELKLGLAAEGFRVLERGRDPQVLEHGSAEWERVFNTRVALQEVRRVLGKVDLATYPLGTRVADPYRKGITFDDEASAQQGIASYGAGGRAVLEQADALVVTIGLSEAWVDPSSGLAFAELPPMPLWDQIEFESTLFTAEQNAEHLIAIIDLVRQVNPACAIILGMEPQPLHVTFAARSVYVSDAISKSHLLLGIHAAVAARPDVHYFPAWEAVSYGAHDRFDWDGRHVSEPARAEVMRVFREMFAHPEEGSD